MTRRFLSAVVPVFVVLAAVACGGDGDAVAPARPQAAPGVVSVELIYLDHPPVQTVIKDIDGVLANFAGKVKVTRYDSESPEGAALARTLGLADHVPVAVAIDREVRVRIDRRDVRFEGFPRGRAPIESAQGSWTIDDLSAALADRIGKTGP